MAKAVKTISKAAQVKADAAMLANEKFVTDEATLLRALERIDGGADEIAEIMQRYANDLIRLASIRASVCAYGMFRWAQKKNGIALAANAKAIPPYVKCDRAYCMTLATWDAKDANGKAIKFPAEFASVREAGYERWRYVCSIGGIDPKVLNPQGAKQTGNAAANKGRRRGARQNKSAAQAKEAANAAANQDAATAKANDDADKLRVNATGVETVKTLAALKSAYQTDEARLIKLQAANAKLYTGDVFKAHEELMAAFKKFYAAAN